MAQDEIPREKLAQLRQRLDPLSKEELRDVCFDLGVKYDDLPGEGAAAKARELVDYLERHCRIPELEHYLAHPPGVSVWRRLRRRPAVLYPAAILLVLIVLTTSVLAATGQLGLVKQQAQKLGLFLEFPPEGKNETLIVIANFHLPAGVPDHEAHNEIKQAIEKAKAELGFASLRVEVEPTHLQADDRAGAVALGKRYNASIVIWGEDTGARVTVNFLNLKQPDFAAAQVKISETERTQLANPSAYARFVTQDLPGQLTFRSLFAVGQSYDTNQQYEDSLKAIEKAVASLTAGTTIEGLADAYFRLGLLYQSAIENNDKAIADYDQGLKLQPDDAEAYNNRGSAYNGKSQYDRAIADFDQALKLKPDLAEAYNNRGFAYYYQGEYDRAIEDLNQALKLKPDSAAAYTNRGLAYAGKGDTARAIADYDQALKLKPDLAEAYNNRGAAYNGKGEYDRAIADFDQALKLKPDYAEAYTSRGYAYYSKGDTDRAIADYEQALRVEPDYAAAYVGRGLAYRNKGDYDRAIADFDQALKLKPDYATAYNNRGNAYYYKGEYDRAIADYDQALKLKPDWAEAYKNRGIAYRDKGDTARAIADFRRYLELLPDAPDRKAVEEMIQQLEAQK
jgi:tetratricopeptide (TPR) repeat protein